MLGKGLDPAPGAASACGVGRALWPEVGRLNWQVGGLLTSEPPLNNNDSSLPQACR